MQSIQTQQAQYSNGSSVHYTVERDVQSRPIYRQDYKPGPYTGQDPDHSLSSHKQKNNNILPSRVKKCSLADEEEDI